MQRLLIASPIKEKELGNECVVHAHYGSMGVNTKGNTLQYQ